MGLETVVGDFGLVPTSVESRPTKSLACARLIVVGVDPALFRSEVKPPQLLKTAGAFNALNDLSPVDLESEAPY